MAKRLTVTVWATDDDGIDREVGRIDLTQDCEDCDGHGKVTDYEAETFVTCPNEDCRNGAELDDGGSALLAFFKTFAEKTS